MTADERSFLVHVDGACSGNPGPAAAAVIIRNAEDGTVVYEEAKYLGRATNNVAEYRALLIALEKLLALRAEAAVVHTDSELMVRQLSGDYKVKAPHLKFVFSRAKRLSSMIPHFELRHISRRENTEADKLARNAIKHARRK